MALCAFDVHFQMGSGTVVKGRRSFSRAAFLYGTAVHTDEDFYIIDNAAFQHGESAFRCFFCRLENEFQFSLFDKVFFHNFFSGSKKHGHMTVVAAEMGGTAVFGSESVHVRTEAQYGTGLAAV